MDNSRDNYVNSTPQAGGEAGGGAAEKKGIFTGRTFQRVGAYAMAVMTAAGITLGAAGCSSENDAQENIQNESNTNDKSLTEEMYNAKIQQLMDKINQLEGEVQDAKNAEQDAKIENIQAQLTMLLELYKQGDPDVSDEDIESHYADVSNYDFSESMNYESLVKKNQELTGATMNGVTYDLGKTFERTCKVLEKHPGYTILPFGGDYSEFARNNDVPGGIAAYLNVLEDEPHTLATNLSLFLTEDEKREAGFPEGISSPEQMNAYLLSVGNGADFQANLLTKLENTINDENTKVSYDKFSEDCESYGVKYSDKDGSVELENIEIGKVKHSGDTFDVMIIETPTVKIYIKLNCGFQPVKAIYYVKPTPTATTTPTPEPTPTVTTTPEPTPTVTTTPEPTPTATTTPKPTPTVTTTPKPTPTVTTTPKPTPTVTTTPSLTPTPIQGKNEENRYETDQQNKENINQTYGTNVSIDNSDSNPGKEQPTEKKDSSAYDGTQFQPSVPPSYNEGNGNKNNGNDNGGNTQPTDTTKQETPAETDTKTDTDTETGKTDTGTSTDTSSEKPSESYTVSPGNGNDFTADVPSTEKKPGQYQDDPEGQQKTNEEQKVDNLDTKPEDVDDDDLSGFNFDWEA